MQATAMYSANASHVCTNASGIAANQSTSDSLPSDPFSPPRELRVRPLEANDRD